MITVIELQTTYKEKQKYTFDGMLILYMHSDFSDFKHPSKFHPSETVHLVMYVLLFSTPHFILMQFHIFIFTTLK